MEMLGDLNVTCWLVMCFTCEVEVNCLWFEISYNLKCLFASCFALKGKVKKQQKKK